MSTDLSSFHRPISDLFDAPRTPAGWKQYRLTDDQVQFFHANGYLAGIRVLNDVQVEALRAELTQLIDPNHPGHHLFYEFHSNESTDPSTILLHALGAWRISPGFHDLLLESRLCNARIAITRRDGTLLARSALLQTSASWRRG